MRTTLINNAWDGINPENLIATGIINPSTGKEYFLTPAYVDTEGDKHFTQEEAIAIGEHIDGFYLSTDEFHKAVDATVWDYETHDWKEDVLGSGLNGFEYMMQILKYELSGYRYNSSGGLGGVGYGGYSWSSSVSSTSGHYLDFSPTHLNPSAAHRRSYGFPVRCLQE